jgi:hypothetical protein
MKKILWILIIVNILISCVKKDNNVKITNDIKTTNENINSIAEDNKIDNKMKLIYEETEKIIKIREIIASDYLYENSKLKIYYDTLEEVLQKFNITDKSKLNIEVIKSRYYPDFDDYWYHYENENFKLSFSKFYSMPNYRIFSFEININDKNYLKLFNDLLQSTKFEDLILLRNDNKDEEDIKAVNFEKRTIRYVTWDEEKWGFNNCYLEFDNNGLLKSFATIFYTS